MMVVINLPLIRYINKTVKIIKRYCVRRKIPFLKKITLNLAFQLLVVTAMIASITFLENLYSLVFFAFIIHTCAGYTFNNYFTANLSQFPQNAGIASGLVGGVVFIIVSFFSYAIVSVIPAKDELNLSFSYLLLALASGVVLFAIFKINKKRFVS